ncbi:DUF742 domain-containing protein [Streptomyces pathocidini]|uniref:DUF742 domain-containing protein n=1 Tax=Streptomyces pathocidini TaxID=1650571 RepID=UPI003400A595
MSEGNTGRDGGGGTFWVDDDAGPVVRPYAMTRGRTRSEAEEKLDLIAVVIAESAHGLDEDAYDADTYDDLDGPGAGRDLSPEHLDIVELCREAPQSVAEVAGELDLPLGVVRVLLGDLITAELVRVSRPVPPAELPDEWILREVIDGLRAL